MLIAAWNGSREASRATFDCLSLARSRTRSCGSSSSTARAAMSSLTASDARAVPPWDEALAGFGVKQGGRSSAEEILHYAGEFNADLLTLGCYGHSRLRRRFSAAPRRISCGR